MSISLEYALENKNAPAVLCCRAEEGLVLSEHNLEDPAIFDDLVDSGLLNLDGAITIGEALGAKLLGTFDSLTPLRRLPLLLRKLPLQLLLLSLLLPLLQAVC